MARIVEQVEAAEAVGEIPNLAKMSGHDSFYRIRLGDHRIGVHVEGDTVEFVRFLHRRDVYRHFP
ncbi:MAG: type II toxin-antitoxin system RelE/ParE family toxin [Actinomycetota bacterium]|nr:type II toxin-antitoxin system RelE/ParE family toxin [Actinomycetota bacterium]